MYGIGNWEDIATHIGTRNGTACKDHYWRCYLQSSEDDEITSPRAALTKEVSVMDGAGGEKKDDATDGQSTDANTEAGKNRVITSHRMLKVVLVAALKMERTRKNCLVVILVDIYPCVAISRLNTITMPNWQ